MSKNEDDSPPQVLEAYWDRGQVLELFADLERAAQVKRVQVRTAADRKRPNDSVMSLDQARGVLDEADTRAVQIHYEFDGHTWCDTLMRLPDSDQIHVIRTIIPDSR